METRLMSIDNIPSEQELILLLGKTAHKYYCTICENITSLLSPDVEIWDYAGRRGKYYHGYHISKKLMTIDLFLSFINGHGQINCNFHFIKRFFVKILKHRNLFDNERIQEVIDFSIKFNEEFGGGYSMDIIIKDEKTFQNVLLIIKILSR
jgi:hypothetical protein